MAIALNDNIKVSANKPSEAKYLNNSTPYTDTAQVISLIPKSERHIGLTVNIDKIEYCFQDGIEDYDLVIKAGGGVNQEYVDQNIGGYPSNIYTSYPSDSDFIQWSQNDNAWINRQLVGGNGLVFDSFENSIRLGQNQRMQGTQLYCTPGASIALGYSFGTFGFANNALVEITGSDSGGNGAKMDIGVPAGGDYIHFENLAYSTAKMQVHSATGKGLEYASNYSSTFGKYSLVDKNYVTGLTLGGGGSGWKLGGTTVLTGDTDVNIGSHNLSMTVDGGYGLAITPTVTTLSSVAGLSLNGGTGTIDLYGNARFQSGELGISDYSDITLGNGGISAQFYSGDLSTIRTFIVGQDIEAGGLDSFRFFGNVGTVVADLNGFRIGTPTQYIEGTLSNNIMTVWGSEIGYGGSTVPTYGNSFTTKNYVDGVTVTASNGLNKSLNRVRLGGSLTGNTTIEMGSSRRLIFSNYPVEYGSNLSASYNTRSLVDKGYVTGITTTLQAKLVQFNRRTVNYTLVLSDAGKVIETNVATGNTVTVPPNSSVAYDIGTSIYIIQYNTGQTTITAGAGVTIRAASNKYKTNVQYSMATLIKVDTNEWYLTGDLTS